MAGIKLKKSSVVGKVPLTSDLDYGELALNYADGKLYYKTAANAVASFLAGPTGSQTTYGSNPPASPAVFDRWIDADNGSEYVYINDGDSLQWVQMGGGNVTASYVNSVAGRTGDVTLSAADVSGVAALASANTFTTNQVISDNSSSAALRITQTGAGNALVVEDSANPDSTPFVVDGSGNVFVGYTASTAPSSVSGAEVQVNSLGSTQASLNLAQWSAVGSGSAQLLFSRSLSGTRGTQAVVTSGTSIGKARFFGSDGTNLIEASSIESFVDGTPGTNDMPGRLVLSTTADGGSTPTEAMRINNAQSVGIGTSSLTGYTLRVLKNLTGGVNAFASEFGGTIQSDVTASAYGVRTNLSTVAAAFTLPSINHFRSVQGTFGAGSIITSQYGFLADSSMLGATSTYGFYGNVSAAPSGGTATSTVSSISSTGTTVTITTAAAHGYSTNQIVTVPLTANATALVSGVTCTILTVGTTDFTLIGAASNTVGVSFTATGAGTGSGTVTLNQQGSARTITVVDTTNFTYTAASSATFTSIVATGTITPATRHNIFATGTAPNYFAGAIGIGYTPTINSSHYAIYLNRTLTGATTVYGTVNTSTAASDVTGNAYGHLSQLSTSAAAFTLTNLRHFWVNQGTIGAGSTVTTQIGYGVDTTLTGATNNYGFYGNIAAGTGRYNLYMNGTAANYMAGDLRIGTTTNTNSSKIVAAGVIESTTGGIKFPDGTTQTSAGASTGKAIAMAIVFGG